MKIRILVFDPMEHVIRDDILSPTAVLELRTAGMIGGTIVGRIEVRVIEDDEPC